MRAKDYYQKYLAYLGKPVTEFYSHVSDSEIGVLVDEIDAASLVCGDLLKEGRELLTARNAKTNSAVVAVFRELNQKFKAFVRLVNNPNVVDIQFFLHLKIHHNALWDACRMDPEFKAMTTDLIPTVRSNNANS